MTESLASDFFRLIITPNNNDKIESYHRVIDLAFKIMSPVHQKTGQGSRNSQNQDAMILYQMAISKGLAILQIIDGVEYKNRETKVSTKILDPTPIAALTRTQFEAFSTFHTIYNSSINKDVINLLHSVWVIAGLKERQKAGVLQHSAFQQKAIKELEVIENLIKKVKENLIFLKQPIEKQTSILEWIKKGKFEMAYRNNKIVLLPQKDLFLNAGVNKKFENQYSILSWFVHPSNISVMQFGQMFENSFNQEHAFTFFNISRIITSMLIVEYCTYFPIAKEEFQKLPKIDQLIVYFDNKTFRSENSFSVDAWQDLEIELQALIKK